MNPSSTRAPNHDSDHDADHGPLPRSPEQLTVDDSALLIVDAQEKLTSLMPDPAGLLFNLERLIDGAQTLDVPILATEQYPEKLGKTHPQLASKLVDAAPKRAFSCGERGELFASLGERGIPKVVIAGLETHVCVLQTALDLLAAGFSVFLAADALAARGQLDHDTALRRLEASGAILTTVETTLFEWCGTSTADGFKAISQIVRRERP